MRPIVIARMPSASTIPTIVAQSMMVADVGMLDLVSMLMPAAAAVLRAFESCAALSGRDVWISHPDVRGVSPVAARRVR